MRALAAVAIVALAGITTACGGDGASAPSSSSTAGTPLGATTIVATTADIPATKTAAPATTVPSTAPQTAPPATMASNTEAPKIVPPPASDVPAVSEAETAELEKALDEIDQVLSDLEADLATDHE